MAALVAASGCVAPATQVVFTIDTDVAPRLKAVLRVTVRWAADASVTVREYRWARAGTALADVDGGALGIARFPAEFTVVPTTGRPDRMFVTSVELDVDDRITLRRVFSRTLLTNQRQNVRVFLAARCLDPAMGCAGEPCTRLRLCEERGQTCGEDGECVAPETPTATEDGGREASVVARTCGSSGEPCCLYGDACDGPFVCSLGVCRRCPAGSEGCCDGDTLRPDGTQCSMPMNSCLAPGTCRAGNCVAGGSAPNGTMCAASADPCLAPSLCQDGVCLAPQPVMDGTMCERSTNPCLADRVCMAGTCAPAQPVTDGTMCAAAGGPCQTPGVCMAGACSGAINVADGTVCRPAANPCETDGVCMAGACSAPQRRPDGTVCARGTNSCQIDGVCMAGACSAITNRPNGTVCAMASDPCQVNGTCTNGMCTGTTSRPDGTVCAMAAGPCQSNGTCSGGRCSGVQNVANGTVCATASGPCQRNGTCTNGACSGVQNVANGTVCATTTNACRNNGTCTNGACGAITNRPNGTVCGAATACRNAPTCQAGTCTAGTARADNTRPTTTTHCCGGNEVNRNNPNECGVCNQVCSTGTCVATAVSGFGTQYYCQCSSNSQCTPQLCRIGQSTLNNRCACRDGSGSTECAGSAVCQMVSNAPNFCRP
ncbi:MAG: hypothetical protein JNK05_23880 [Myxococcales bacterium]|nr:hypothetical protein [Myxococcales bacterium]